MTRVVVLRLGHRPGRDRRVTTHVGLVARAFGASGIVIADVSDVSVVSRLKRVCEIWGGRDFLVVDGVNSLEYVTNWKKLGGVVVHLTMYGIHIDSVVDEIRSLERDILIVVGATKVPKVYYELADYNVAIGHQPHSEVAALAVFLDRLYLGRELRLIYSDAKLCIEPSPRGKKVVMCE
ncbi:MAG: tRNA methyltransferase [Sulfolobales archaeon]|nr:tRNA methyltransferase [Sulfolobales archaeon]MDW8082203.1 tRNA methyltransferase [Sulfolobales archaeon]